MKLCASAQLFESKDHGNTFSYVPTPLLAVSPSSTELESLQSALHLSALRECLITSERERERWGHRARKSGGLLQLFSPSSVAKLSSE